MLTGIRNIFPRLIRKFFVGRASDSQLFSFCSVLFDWRDSYRLFSELVCAQEPNSVNTNTHRFTCSVKFTLNLKNPSHCSNYYTLVHYSVRANSSCGNAGPNRKKKAEVDTRVTRENNFLPVLKSLNQCEYKCDVVTYTARRGDARYNLTTKHFH